MRRVSIRSLVFSLVTVMLVGTLIGGCEAITNAAKFKVPITVTIHPKSDNPVVPFVDEDCTDLSTNKDFIDNKDKFEEATVKEIKVLISQLVDPEFTSGSIADQYFSHIKVYLTFDPIYNDPTVYEIGVLQNISLASILGPIGGTPMIVPKSSGADAAVSLILHRPKFCVSVDYGAMNTGPARAKFIQADADLTISFEGSAI